MTDMAAIIAAELAALAADAKTLATRLSAGDVVQAVVLPSNGLTDLLDIGGLRVAAELPPSLLPGETIAVKVVGFGGDRINLQVIETPSAPPSQAAGLRRAAPSAARAALPVTTAAAFRPPTAPQTAIEARLAASHAMTLPTGPSSGGAGVLVRPLIAVRPPPSAPAAAASPKAAPRAFAGAALLRALRLPVTAANLGLVRLGVETPQRLPTALDVLEGALDGSADPALATLTVLTSFVARIDPRSPVLAAQIAGFADHVAVGSEAKIAQLLDVAGGPRVEQLAGLRTALDYDLKTQLLTVAAARRDGRGELTSRAAALDGALAGALTAVTAAQLEAAAGAACGAFAFRLPLESAAGPATATIRVEDPPCAGLDAANFRLAIGLQTRRLGNVGISVATVDGVMTVNVAVETGATQRALDAVSIALRERLERLPYDVTRIETAVGRPVNVADRIDPPAPADVPAARVDVDA